MRPPQPAPRMMTSMSSEMGARTRIGMMRIVRKAACGTADRPRVLRLTFGTKALVTLPEVLFL